MASRNVETYRAGHEAFNRRDFEAMTGRYADSISWTDHAQERTSGRPRSSGRLPDRLGRGLLDIRITGARYLDADRTVVCTFTVAGRQDGPLGPFPATGKQFALPLCEMWHFDSAGQVVGGDLYYDQVSLLTHFGLMPQPSA